MVRKKNCTCQHCFLFDQLSSKNHFSGNKETYASLHSHKLIKSYKQVLDLLRRCHCACMELLNPQQFAAIFCFDSVWCEQGALNFHNKHARTKFFAKQKAFPGPALHVFPNSSASPQSKTTMLTLTPKPCLRALSLHIVGRKQGP